MNDMWNLDHGEERYIYMYRLQHDISNGNFDTKWIKPDKNEITKGTRYERVPDYRGKPGRKRTKQKRK